jgi:hypothetical protein
MFAEEEERRMMMMMMLLLLLLIMILMGHDGGQDGSEERIPCRYLVGCDGAHSLVRKQLGLPFEGSIYEDIFVMADIRVSDRLLAFPPP